MVAPKHRSVSTPIILSVVSVGLSIALLFGWTWVIVKNIAAGEEVVRRRSPLRAQKQQANIRGQKKKPATKPAARPQYQDDPINQYYRNRPKQKPSRARATYLDEKLEAEEKERSDPSVKRNQAKIQTYSDHLA